MAKRLRDAQGNPLSIENLPDDAERVIVTGGEMPVIPEEVYGFKVKCGLAPYPPDAENSHRRAMYAVLDPIDSRAQDLCRSLNRARLLAWVPLTEKGAYEIAHEPDSELAEQCAMDALRAAVREIKRYFGEEDDPDAEASRP